MKLKKLQILILFIFFVLNLCICSFAGFDFNPQNHTTINSDISNNLFINSENNTSRGTLNFYQLFKIFSTDDSLSAINNSIAGQDASQWANSQLGTPQYPVKAYQIKYWSINFKNEPILVSGAVLVPMGVESPMALQIFQHATIIKNSSAPSDIEHSAETKILAAVMASHGNIVAMTDYVGNGLCASSDNHDEYLYAESAAENGADILIAVYQMLSKLNISTNGKLFISGYSEGGQAAAALANLLQSNYPQYPVTAAAFMEGPYSITAELNYLLTPPGVALNIGEFNLNVGSIICAKAMYAYNFIYGWTDNLNDLFVFPYANRVMKNFETSSPDMIQLAFAFKQNTVEMLTSSFLNELYGRGKIANDIASNNTFNWTPVMPVIFLTSNADTLIPWKYQEPYYQQIEQSAPDKVSMQFSPFNLDHLQNLLPDLVLASKFFNNYQ